MSHNTEPERAARRHTPAIIGIAVALSVAVAVFLVFGPGDPPVEDVSRDQTSAPVEEAEGNDGGALDEVAEEADDSDDAAAAVAPADGASTVTVAPTAPAAPAPSN